MSRHDRTDRPAPIRRGRPLMEGPRWYKRRIRVRGPLYGLVPMATLGVIAIGALVLGDGRMSGLLGLLAGTAAAPGLLIAGAPFGDQSSYPLAVLASVPFWFVLGGMAAWRATRRPAADWTDYGRELVFLTIAVVVGVGIALLAATAIVGESLIL